MSVPSWWETLLLAAAAYRIWRLVALDRIFERPRDWLLDRLDREDLDYFVTCPWCFGFWISIGLWGAWLIVPEWTVGLCVPLAVSAAVGLVAKLDPPET